MDGQGPELESLHRRNEKKERGDDILSPRAHSSSYRVEAVILYRRPLDPRPAHPACGFNGSSSLPPVQRGGILVDFQCHGVLSLN
jgi:hypothetical protein